jgi:hypothetical protein
MRVSVSPPIDAVTLGFDQVQPGLGQLFGEGDDAPTILDEAAMRAGADADIFAVAPVGQIVRLSAPGRRGSRSRRPAGRARR